MTRRKPDVRFGEPNEKASGFRIVRISNVRDLLYCPDFRSIQLPERLKSGHKCPVIGRLLYLKRLKSGRFQTGRLKSGQYCPDFEHSGNCIDQNRFQTGLEPVLVDTIARTFKIRTQMSGFQTSGLKSSSSPSFLYWNRTSEIRRFGNRTLFESAEIRTFTVLLLKTSRRG